MKGDYIMQRGGFGKFDGTGINDGINKQATEQGPGWNVNQHRNAMRREIKAKDYFNSHNDNDRKATDRVMKWLEEKIQDDNNIDYTKLDMKKINYIRRCIKNNYSSNKESKPYKHYMSITEKLDKIINDDDVEVKNSLIREVLNLLETELDKQRDTTKEEMRTYAKQIKDMMKGQTVSD